VTAPVVVPDAAVPPPDSERVADAALPLPYRVTERITRGGTTFELLEYAPLAGSEPFTVAEQCFTLNKAGVRLRQLRVRLTRDAVRTEPGALQFLKGRITMESNTGAGDGFGGLLRGALAAARTGETMFKPLYRGEGELYLEPTFGHFWLRELRGETLYADQGLFFCCEDSVAVEAHKVESFSARMAGGEGRYQTKVSGTGLVVFRIPVPREEIVPVALHDETLQVDGSFALLRTGDVHFSVERAGNSMAAAVTSGEGAAADLPRHGHRMGGAHPAALRAHARPHGVGQAERGRLTRDAARSGAPPRRADTPKRAPRPGCRPT
jgi:uncharacterized protein (AIM24 family)